MAVHIITGLIDAPDYKTYIFPILFFKRINDVYHEKFEKVLELYGDEDLANAPEEIEKYSHLARDDELKENDFNLNIPRYVDTFEEEAEIDIEAVQQEIDTLESELAEVRDKMVTLLKEVTT